MTTFSGPLFFEGGGASLQRQRYTVGHADFTAAAATEAVSMTTTLPAGAIVLGKSHQLPTSFSGGSITAATIDVGINGGNLDEYVDAADVFTAFTYAPTGGDGTAPAPLTAATTVYITLNTTGGDVADADAGSYEVDIYYFCVTANPDDQ